MAVRTCIWLVLVNVLLPHGLWAQTPATSPATPAIKVTTRLVVLNVVVRDKSGKAVSNLGKDDFTILENDQRHSIDSFEAPSGLSADPQRAPALDATIASSALPRTILVLDELNTISEDMMFAKQKVEKFLRAQPPVLFQPTSIFLLTKRRLQLFAAPTRDRDALLASLKKAILELPSHSLDSGGVQGGADRLLATLLALDEIALSNAEQKTRKNVIWIGNGIPILSASSVTITDRDRFMNWIHYTANWLEETQTTVYTVDPRGLEVVPEALVTDFNSAIVSGPDLTPSELVFESIAAESGGAILRRRNDIDVEIAMAVSDGSSYYTLGYYPTDHNWDGKYRRIKVNVATPGAAARTQQGYYAFADGFQNSGDQIEFGLSRAVTSPLPFRSVSFTATGERVSGGATQKAAATATPARVVLSIERESLSWTPQASGGQRAEVTLVTSEISASGRVLGYRVREVEVTLAKSKLQEAEANKPVQLFVRLELPAKTDHIRLVVRDAASGHLGTFDVPAGSLSTASNTPREN